MPAFSRDFTIRWSDCDANGHLRNTCYSEYAIEVRMAWLAEHGFGLPEFHAHGVGPVLLREEIDYLRECHMGEVVTVDFTVLGRSADGSRFKVAHQLLKAGGKVAARLVVHGGWLDLSARRLRPPPAPLQAIWDGLEHGEGYEVLGSRGPG